MTQDPDLFPEPEKFIPERFINPTESRLMDYTLSFGFGRRICPGQHVAQNSLLITMARCVSAVGYLVQSDRALPELLGAVQLIV